MRLARHVRCISTDTLRKHTAKLKDVMKQYGKVAVVVHSTVFVSTLGVAFTCIESGIDIRHVKIPFVDMSKIDPNAGTFLLAYLATVATGPLRGGLTIAITPWIARIVRKRAT
ncbi:hypothetical protein THRCLA_00588 [Thraustotheca clavata]|uniref:DUF1279 domain-containing protein n=1 Tax=Thraustotheca clavata TaxID=74557 RepID=A0A1W0AAS7_9STRA|nr:hypothetical protein THRCLA_00588 [Thraustotheca clavata]